jgi:hypothetical protein
LDQSNEPPKLQCCGFHFHYLYACAKSPIKHFEILYGGTEESKLSTKYWWMPNEFRVISPTGIHMQLMRTAPAKADVHKHGKKYGNLACFGRSKYSVN